MWKIRGEIIKYNHKRKESEREDMKDMLDA